MKKFEVNGMDVVDRMLREHGVIGADEVWVHGMWTPGKWAKCLKAKLRGKKLVRMTHGSLSPIYLEKQGKWKKCLVKPFEKLLFRLADKIVFTGEWEAEWFEKWMPGQEGKFEIVDLKRYFRLEGGRHNCTLPSCDPLHVLYLGRRHPLKGVEYLEKAVSEINATAGQNVVVPSESKTRGVGTQVLPNFACAEGTCVPKIELRIVSNHFGEELEKDWEWCDVLCLPTLSENFGLVVAEALERGKRVITTDGAPAWAPEKKVEGGRLEVEQWRERLFYIKGYRDGSEEARVKLLKDALKMYV